MSLTLDKYNKISCETVVYHSYIIQIYFKLHGTKNDVISTFPHIWISSIFYNECSIIKEQCIHNRSNQRNHTETRLKHILPPIHNTNGNLANNLRNAKNKTIQKLRNQIRICWLFGSHYNFLHLELSFIYSTSFASICSKKKPPFT